MPPPERPTYSKAQISTYLTHISLPQRHQSHALSIASSGSVDEQLDFLTSLQRHQLCTIPFENLAIHYSPHHTVSLDPDHLYNKIIANNRGRGGYCMENNCFFGTVLRTLGFKIYSAGARVSDGVNGGTEGTFGAWSHMVNIVTLANGQKYMMDVGFGADGPTRPLPLINALETHDAYPGIGAQELRLIHTSLPLSLSDSSQKLWVYQRRASPDSDWREGYAFSEMEFLPRDYEMMNFWTSQSRSVFFTYAIVVVKMLMEREEVVGQLILFGGEVKRRIRGETEVVLTCKGEEGRVRALEEWFGLKLTGEERRGIRSLVTELKG